METTTRTIIHYSLRVLDKDGTTLDPHIITKTMDYIIKLNKTSRKLDDTTIKKVHFLDTLSHSTGVLTGNFKSAKYDYRPALIEKNTLTERKSPKLQTEGESELTHFGMAVDTDDILLFLELKRNGVSITNFVRYVKMFLTNINNKCYIEYGLSVKGDFSSKLKELSRASSVEIYVPHKIVTDTFGDEAVSMKNIKHDAIISVQAEKSTSIKQAAKDLFNLMSNQKADISRIRIYGKIGDLSNTILDTNKLKDKSTLTVEVDDNKQVISTDILSKIKEAIGLAL